MSALILDAKLLTSLASSNSKRQSSATLVSHTFNYEHVHRNLVGDTHNRFILELSLLAEDYALSLEYLMFIVGVSPCIYKLFSIHGHNSMITQHLLATRQASHSGASPRPLSLWRQLFHGL